MEPQCHDPDNVKNHVYRICECVLDKGEPVSRIMGNSDVEDFRKHHVVPEVEQVQEQSEKDYYARFCIVSQKADMMCTTARNARLRVATTAYQLAPRK